MAVTESLFAAHAVYGAYNRSIVRLYAGWVKRGLVTDDVVLPLRCSCGRDDCDSGLALKLSEYESLGVSENRFVVAPGHERAETVVARKAACTVVEIVDTA